MQLDEVKHFFITLFDVLIDNVVATLKVGKAKKIYTKR